MVNTSEGTLRRRHVEPAYAGYGQAQKGLAPGCATYSCTASTQKEPGVEYRPKATQDGHTERENPLRLSPEKVSR